MTTRTRAWRALSIATLTAVALTACGSQTPSMPTPPTLNPATATTETYCSIFDTKCGPQATDHPDPNQSTYHSIFDSDTPAPPDHQQSATWGDMKFGDCSVSLWPARVGVGVIKGFYSVPDAPTSQNHTRAAIYGEASTVCVGYQPKQFIIHIHLQLWSFITVPGDPHPQGAWNDAPGSRSVIASSQLPPIGIINPRTGMPPFSMQHIYHVWTPCVAASTKTYRLLIDIVGVSYGGSPIVGGGEGATFTSLPGDC